MLQKLESPLTKRAIAARKSNKQLVRLRKRGISLPFILPHLHKDAPQEIKNLAVTLSLLDSLVLYKLSSDTRHGSKFGKERLTENEATELVKTILPTATYVGTGGFRHTFKVANLHCVVKICHTLCPINGWDLQLYRFAARIRLGKILATPYYVSSTVGVYEYVEPIALDIVDVKDVARLLNKAEARLDLDDLWDSKGLPNMDNIGMRQGTRELVILDYAEPSRFIGYSKKRGNRDFKRVMRLA